MGTISTSPRPRSLKNRRPVRDVLSRIRLFATDVDGVLTDAGMYYAESGDEWKKFNTRDGMGIKLLQRAGLITAIVTQERTKLVARRAEKLAIPELHQGVMDKLLRVREMVARHGLTLSQVAYIGQKKGGEGAVREIIELILEAQGAKLEVRSSKFHVAHSGKRS